MKQSNDTGLQQKHFGRKELLLSPCASVLFFSHHSLEVIVFLILLGTGVLQSPHCDPGRAGSELSLSAVVAEEGECNEPQYSSASRSEFNLKFYLQYK